MPNKIKYIIYSVLDFGLTYGGSVAILILNYIDKDTSTGYKLSLTGIILVVCLMVYSQKIFEHQYQAKYNSLLQQLASATDNDIKAELNSQLDNWKMANNVYLKLIELLPFATICVLCWIGQKFLAQLQTTMELFLATTGAGGVFNVLKKPIAEKVSLDKVTAKVNKKKNNI